MTSESSSTDTSSDAPALSDSSADRGTGIRLSGFSLSAGGRPLLTDAGAEFPAGQVSLIVGCSGVGKSLLLKILAGLIDADHDAIRWQGAIAGSTNSRADNDSATEPQPLNTSSIAVVFQNYALLDELSPVENVEIAIDHSSASTGSRNEVRQKASRLLDQLGVPTDRPTSVLSGGQQQRLAIARAIAMDTDVILFDEPTSGLDGRTAAKVADLIHTTQQQFQRTAVIVTHDFESLQSIADQIFVLDHQSLALRKVPTDEWNQLSAIIGEPPAVDTDGPEPPGRTAVLRQQIAGFLARSGQGVEEVLSLPWSLLPLWTSVRWGLRSTLHYLRLVAGPSACVYIMIAGVIIGFVSQDFIFRYLPFRQYTEPLLIENLLHATGFSLYRFLIPILCTILVAARSGAAVSADVGSKVYGSQIDAMKTIGMNPRRSLRTPILYAFLIGTPVLTMLSYVAASVTAALVFLTTHAEQGIAFWDAHFHKELRDPGSMLYHGTDWLIAKLLCCAVSIAMIAWNCGSAPKQSAPEISNGVTRTILWSTLLVLLVHFVFSLMEFKVVK